VVTSFYNQFNSAVDELQNVNYKVVNIKQWLLLTTKVLTTTVAYLKTVLEKSNNLLR
jgi:hypothetical protein